MSVPEESRIRHQFVGMLFALTIGQIAVHFYELASIPHPGERCWAAGAHLVLCTLLVVASWVGWSRSKAPGTQQHVTGVFSVPFLVLLLDVMLVVLYFIMVQEVEIENLLLGGKYIAEPSAREEAKWMIWVFSVYLTWDIVADVIARLPELPTLWSKPPTAFPERIVEKVFASMVCGGLTIAAYITTATSVHGVWAVVSTDAALIVLVFLFRAMKPLEQVLRRDPGGLSRRERYRQAKKEHRELIWVSPFLAFFTILLVIAHVVEPTVK